MRTNIVIDERLMSDVLAETGIKTKRELMATQDEQSSSILDTAILWLSVVVLCASIFGYYWFEPQYNDLIRVLGMLAGSALAVVIALQTNTGKTAWSYVQGSRTELRRVVWPTRQETINYTIVVMITLVILTAFIAGLDFAFGEGILRLLRLAQ